MVGEDRGTQRLDGGKEGFQQRWIVQIGALLAEAAVRLRDDRAAEPVLAAAQIDQQELGIAGILPQLRRQRVARILHWGEG